MILSLSYDDLSYNFEGWRQQIFSNPFEVGNFRSCVLMLDVFSSVGDWDVLLLLLSKYLIIYVSAICST